MSPVQTAIPDTNGRRAGPTPSYLSLDVFLAPARDAFMEIVVDWQMPADRDHSSEQK
ncbi:MAG: hypothetical protein M3203_03945 [Actinomycetota bacterium]|nr:hypothetical protein [Actinomycetota bacterium]